MSSRWFALNESKGFTLLEVSLFLAVSAGLVIIAIAGLAPRLRNVRFTSAVRGIETSVDKEFSVGGSFENVRTGGRNCAQSGAELVISNEVTGSSVGTAAQCVVAGKALQFGQERITVRPIIALREADSACVGVSGTLESFISCFKPLLYSSSDETKFIEYQSGLRLAFVNGQTLSERDAAQVSSGVGYMVHPQTGQRFNVQLNKTGSDFSLFAGSITSTGTLSAQANFSTPLCFQLDNRVAKMTFVNTSLKPQTDIGVSCP